MPLVFTLEKRYVINFGSKEIVTDPTSTDGACYEEKGSGFF
jgi:hypothetical protein